MKILGFVNLKTDWSLDELYSGFDSFAFKQDLEECEKVTKGWLAYTEELLGSDKSDAQKIEEYLVKTLKFSRLQNTAMFAYLKSAVDTEDAAALKVIDKVTNLSAEMAKPEAIFDKFVSGIGDLDAVIAQSGVLKEHAYMLKRIKKQSKYRLSENEEAAVAKMRATGSDAWDLLHGQLTATLMIDVETEPGKVEKKPLSAVRNMAYSADKDLRKRAYEAELKGCATIDKPIAAALNAIKGEVITTVKMRGYESALEMTALNSRMDLEILNALISSMEDYLPSLRRFYKKKAKMLGHEGGLPWYDLFAPVGTSDMRFTYEQGADFVVKNFSAFSPKLGEFARNAFENAWIDALPKEGKRGGAFCMNLHEIRQSRVLSNFDGSFNDVSTLGHELGHAYHGDCLNNETAHNCDYPMPIAETASTFCETIIANAALKTASDSEKVVILENMIGDSLQVIVDIYSRFVFERELFKRREDGPLSVEELKTIMLDAQKAAYGDGLDENCLHPYMWLVKGHYYSAGYNFYNFPYAYGLLFAKGLYASFLADGAAFLPKYDALLAATGKNDLDEVGKLAEVDVRSKEFWTNSLKLIEKDVDEFCAL